MQSALSFKNDVNKSGYKVDISFNQEIDIINDLETNYKNSRLGAGRLRVQRIIQIYEEQFQADKNAQRMHNEAVNEMELRQSIAATKSDVAQSEVSEKTAFVRRKSMKSKKDEQLPLHIEAFLK
jgi:hypothetical protein